MQDNNLQARTKGKRRRRNENGILFGSIMLCLVTLSAITFCLVLVFKYRASQLETKEVMSELETLQNRYTEEEVQALLNSRIEEARLQASQETEAEVLDEIKNMVISEGSAIKMLRYFYPDDVVIYDANNYYFFPVIDTLKRNTYKAENFVNTDEGLIEYYEDDALISHKGIDVSRYQETIDWEKVANDGVEYAFIRLGIRGYSEGKISKDDRFEYNIEEALKNDVAVGVYFFTQATSVEEAEEEAQFVLDEIEAYDVTYPVVIDVEALSNDNARTVDLTREERTDYCIAFCNKIKQAGYTPMIYGNLKTFMLMLDIERIEEYDKWFAQYDTQAYFPYEFKVWQYTDEGSVDGIDVNVDINISFENLSQ